MQTSTFKNRFVSAVLALMVFLLFLVLLPVTARASTNNKPSPEERCVKELNVDKKDKKIDACVRGFGFADANKKITSCDNAYKKSKQLERACKSGFNLRKSIGQGRPGSTADLSTISAGGLPQSEASQSTVENVLRIIFGIIGAFALLNITLSGFKYITAAGSEQKISEAKNGIVYSLVGLMVAITAQAIVSFVVHRTSP